MPYIGKGANGFGIRERYRYSASGSQTAFTGSDLNSKTLQFDSGSLLDVYLNGVLLDTADYNTSTANTVTLTSGASASDEIMIIVYDIFSLSDAMPKTGGTFTGGITGTTGTFSGDLTVDTDTLFVDVSQDNVGINTNAVDSDVALEVNGNVAFKNGSNYSLYADVDGGLTAYHNGSSKLTTTSDGVTVTGRVIKTLQPAFQAYYANNSYCWTDTTDGNFDLQTLNQTRFNRGNHYDTTNHRFIAPVAGVYFFYGQFYTNYTSNYARAGVSIRVNGTGRSETWINCWETTSSAVSSLTIELAANDYVQLYTAVYDGNATSNSYNVWCGAEHTYLTGHLIG